MYATMNSYVGFGVDASLDVALPAIPTATPPPAPVGRPQGTAPVPGPRPLPGTSETATSEQPGATGAGVIDRAKAWWAEQATGTKVAVGVGAAAVVGLLLYAILGGKKSYKPNRRAPSRRRLTSAQKRALGRIRGKRGRARVGRITTVKGGRRYGHLKPPQRYWRMGARRPTDYADPQHYKYPLVFRTRTGRVKPVQTQKHIRAAKSYFSRHKTKYPMTIRRRIARNINRAAKRYGVGGSPMRP